MNVYWANKKKLITKPNVFKFDWSGFLCSIKAIITSFVEGLTKTWASLLGQGWLLLN